jgi:RNA polymerase sigma-70 factor (ECF subfamily)
VIATACAEAQRTRQAAEVMSMSDPDTDSNIRRAYDAGDLDLAATLALEAYGSEILSFLVARLRSMSEGQEAFSIFAEDLWRGLPAFGWRCAIRTWSYTLARNAANRLVAVAQRRPDRNLALSQHPSVSQAIGRARSATQIHQRTDVKDGVRALREQLEPDDQMLLLLRIDRDLSWRDAAIAMSGNAELDDDAIDRESVRLRKRFERIKTDLRRMAEQAGLLDRGGKPE